MSDSPSPRGFAIVRYADLAAAAHVHAALDAIFFEASSTKAFVTPAERSAFRERWLGRYLRLDPGLAFLALAPADRVAGYLVGCCDDPARTPRFDDVGYFQLLADLTVAYPAHLHVNLAPEFRGSGLGGRLVETFVASVRDRGAPGAHVVTSHSARNAGFYERHGFRRLRVFPWNGRDLVMLGRALSG